MRPSKIAAPVRQASGRQRIGIAGHAQHRAGHRIETPRRCASVTRIRSGSTGGTGSIELLHIAVGQHDVDGFGFLRGGGGGGIIGRDQRAADHAALRGAGAGAAGERLQQPRGAAGAEAENCRRRFRWPRRPCRPECPPASPHIAHPAALARTPPAAKRQQRAGAQAEQPQPATAGRNHVGLVTNARSCVGACDAHLSKNIRQTTRVIDEKPRRHGTTCASALGGKAGLSANP